MKLIQKMGVAKFRVSTPEVAGEKLDLDFSPLISQFNLKGNFTLIHWQAKPKGYREWGIYTSRDDSYRSVGRLKLNSATVSSLQLNDKNATSIPSAVLYTNEDRCSCINDLAILGGVMVTDLDRHGVSI